MCILFIAVQQHKEYPLIIAANRDEFFSRPTLSSHWWNTPSPVLSGIDSQAGGTWMGVNKNGYLAALTNIRNSTTYRKDVASRGQLVSEYLTAPSDDYPINLQRTRSDYNGYNLLFGHWTSLKVYNNQQDTLSSVPKGVYGLSNDSLNSPWPKIIRGIQSFQHYCQNQDSLNEEVLFELLLDKTKANDLELPKTGIPLALERHLSSIFIQGKEYGTRSSTVLKIDHKGSAEWIERTFNNEARCICEKNNKFSIN